jgi:hypothetical protein
MHSHQFIVRSKPILPLHIPTSFAQDMHYTAYNPDLYPAAVSNDLTSSPLLLNPSDDQMHMLLQDFAENGSPHRQFLHGTLSAAQSAPSIFLPDMSYTEPTNFQHTNEAMFGSFAKQHVRKRTAQACEKCRARKTKVRYPVWIHLFFHSSHPHSSALVNDLHVIVVPLVA